MVSWFFAVFGWFPWFFKLVSWFFMVFGWFPWFFKVVRWFFIVFGVIFFGLCVIFFINLSIDEPDGKEDKELLTLKTIR